mmetsp:Transcript_481/g.1325  ORF Transcript_481/g.1325 Transcript_481/m.1325 type:complete len:240 (-) Transcript_481:458-1177(-)
MSSFRNASPCSRFNSSHCCTIFSSSTSFSLSTNSFTFSFNVRISSSSFFTSVSIWLKRSCSRFKAADVSISVRTLASYNEIFDAASFPIAFKFLNNSLPGKCWSSMRCSSSSESASRYCPVFNLNDDFPSISNSLAPPRLLISMIFIFGCCKASAKEAFALVFSIFSSISCCSRSRRAINSSGVSYLTAFRFTPSFADRFQSFFSICSALLRFSSNSLSLENFLLLSSTPPRLPLFFFC